MVLNKVRTPPNVSELYKWVSVRKAEEMDNQFLTTRHASSVGKYNDSKTGKASRQNSMQKSSSTFDMYAIHLSNNSKLDAKGKENGFQMSKTSTRRLADKTTKRKTNTKVNKSKQKNISKE